MAIFGYLESNCQQVIVSSFFSYIWFVLYSLYSAYGARGVKKSGKCCDSKKRCRDLVKYDIARKEVASEITTN